MLVNDFQTIIEVSKNKHSYVDLCNNDYFIFHAFSKKVENPIHSGVFSVNCTFEGEEFYKVENGTYKLGYSNYLILNEETQRISYIASDGMVESFSINFSQVFLRNYLRSSHEMVEKIFDDPFYSGSESFQFFEQLYDHDLMISPLLFKIRHLINNGKFNRLEMDELTSYLMESMILSQDNIKSFILHGNAMKHSTRKELYKRLTRARDYAFSCFKENISIDDLSGIACLNKHYFLREFKKMFRTTPYGFIQSLRLKEAAHLLRSTNKMVIEVCQEIGYDDQSSFCRLFKKEFNRSPVDYRKVNRTSQLLNH